MQIGHVHLKVSNIDRALKFWRDLLGFKIQSQHPQVVFLAAGDYHHHIALNTWESLDGQPPAAGTTGLYHVAILFPMRIELAAMLKRILDSSYPISGVADHGVSEAVYLSDPDGNGVELSWDRPTDLWPRKKDGTIQMDTKSLDITDLLSELKQ